MTLAVLPQTLTADDAAKIRTELLDFYRRLGRSFVVSLAALGVNGWTVTGPVRGAVAFRTQLGKLLELSGGEGQKPDGAALYESISASAGQLGTDWAEVVFIGKAPALDPALNEYAAAYLGRRFRAARLRVSFWPAGESGAGVWDEVARATGGVSMRAGVESFPSESGAKSFAELDCAGPQISRGFVLYRAAWLNAAGVAVEGFPALAAAVGTEPASVARYAELRSIAREAAATAGKALTRESREKLLGEVKSGLAIDAADPEMLRVGANIAEHAGEHKAAAGLLAAMAEVKPADAAVFGELGHERMEAGEPDKAEIALTRARQLKAGDARVSEDLGRVAMARGRDAAAIGLLEESLREDGGAAWVWFLRADVAKRLGDRARETESLERGLALRGDLERRTELIGLYLEQGRDGAAMGQVRTALPSLPADGRVLGEYAEFLERLREPEEALKMWREALRAAPGMEEAHYRIATLLLRQRGGWRESLRAADEGLAAAPGSARLYVVKSEALEEGEQDYAAREVLRTAAKSHRDAGLMARLAALDDVSGTGAAGDYMELARLLDAPGAGKKDEYVRVLRRGLEVSIRDEEDAASTWFQARLREEGAGAGELWVGLQGTASRHGAWVPGGLDALAFVAGSRAKGPPERFFLNYCRQVRVSTAYEDKKQEEQYVGSIREHFRLMTELEALGTRKGRTVTILLSLADGASRRRTKKVMSLLGWKLRAGKKGVDVAAGEKTKQAKRQDTASALGMDEASVEDALGQGKPYAMEIRDEWAPMVVDEQDWRKQFYPAANYPGGFAEAVAVDPRLARVYAGFARMEAAAAEAVVSGIGLKQLVEKYAELFYQASSALAVEVGRAAAPGGRQADGVWRKLTGADPANPGRFFQALFEKDDGNLLEFYATLAQLDLPHQRLFTASVSRAEEFYRVQRDTPEYSLRRRRVFGGGPFTEFLRGVPLDGMGRVLFPGGPEVWMVAKGGRDDGRVSRKLSKVSRADQEDEILLRLAKTRYSGLSSRRISELDNYLAVARVDAHRSKPLDAASALLLAQWYAEAGTVYPYFAVLTGLEFGDFQQFFELAAYLRQHHGSEWNEELGEVHSLIELLCLFEEAGRLGERQAAAQFSAVCRRYLAADSAERMAEAGLESVRAILAEAGGATQPPDEGLRTMLLGTPGAVNVALGGREWEVDSVKDRAGEYDEVIEMQKTPRLAPLLAILDAAAKLKAGGAEAEGQLAAIEKAAAVLDDAAVSKKTAATGKQRKDLTAFQPGKLRDLAARLKRQEGKRKTNGQEVDKLCGELLAEINPLVEDSLAGVIYAYYLRPADLLVSEDPLLVRKHRFTPLNPTEKNVTFPALGLEVSSEGVGSYFEGGFAGFSELAGQAAANGKNGMAEKTYLGMQLGAIRATPWPRLRDADLRLAALRIRLGREWILESAEKAEAKSALEEATQGLLSVGRRSDLLNAIDRRDWRSAWGSVTLGDLYHLGEAALGKGEKAGWSSPVVEAATSEMHRGPHRMNLFGATLLGLFGCDHSHLLAVAPYEEYEHEVRPNDLAERTSEFKLYLADYAVRQGLPAAAMGAVAEPVLRRLMEKLTMADPHDWRAVLASLSQLDDAGVEEALEKR